MSKTGIKNVLSFWAIILGLVCVGKLIEYLDLCKNVYLMLTIIFGPMFIIFSCTFYQDGKVSDRSGKTIKTRMERK